MKKAIILGRASTTAQVKKGSLEQQEADLLRMANFDGYEDSEIITIGYAESGIYLSEEERQGLKDMYEAIENNNIECVYIWQLSRLSRRPQTLYKLRDYFIDNKINLKCYNPSFFLLNDDGSYNTAATLPFSIYVGLCESEMTEKKVAFKRAKKAKALKGMYVGGVVKFGYKVDRDKKYIIDDVEGDIVRLTYNLYENLQSYVYVWRELKERGYNLNLNTVQTILRSVEYTGKVEQSSYIKNKRVKGKEEPLQITQTTNERIYPIIISKEQFERCRKIANDNKTNGSNKPTHIYYSYDLIKCPNCGRWWKPAFNVKAYMCKDKYKNYYKENKTEVCNNCESININVIDSLLWSVIPIKEANYQIEQATQDIAKYNDDIEILNQKINATDINFKLLKDKKDRVNELYMDGDITKDAKDKRINVIKEEENVINNQIIEWTDKIDKLKELIKLINQKNYYIDIPTERDITITERVEYIKGIEDDEVRYNLIHKHIKEVNICEHAVGKVKLITIYFNDNTVREFYYHYKTHNKKVTFLLDGVEVLLVDYFIQRFAKQPTKHRKHLRDKKSL